MTYKSILLPLTNNEDMEVAQAVAFDLALEFDANLAALALQIEPMIPHHHLHPVLLDALDVQREAAREEADRLTKAASEAAKAAGLSIETRIENCYLNNSAEIIARHARYSDLVVMLLQDMDDPILGEHLAEQVITESGKPVLVVPAQARSKSNGRRVLIAWDASAQASRAVTGALPLICAAEETKVLCVDPEIAPNAHGSDPGADIARYLARHGAKVEVEVVDRGHKSIAEALLDQSQESDADVIVMGAYSHHRLRELMFGGVTQGVLAGADRPILAAH